MPVPTSAEPEPSIISVLPTPSDDGYYFDKRLEKNLVLYCEPHVLPIPVTHRLVALCYPCGTGKTKEIQRFITQQCETRSLRILLLHHRKSMSIKANQTFPAIHGIAMSHYEDIKGQINLNDVSGLICQIESVATRFDMLRACQIESVARISSLLCKDKDTIVILDEFNSIINQIAGGCGNCSQTSAVFNYLMQKSAMVVAMDGYFDQERLDILEKYGKEPALHIHNTGIARHRARRNPLGGSGEGADDQHHKLRLGWCL